MLTVAALYVETGGAYFNLPGVDPWDEERDARLYGGPHPVVAHPPCDRWHQLSAVNAKRWGYVINQDGGCFASALAAVRRWGGVLKHPAETRAFKMHGIPEPRAGHWQRTIDGDWVTEVNQAAYGHRARKRTWLLACHPSPPGLDWADARGSHQIGFFDQKRPQLPTAERSATPQAFRDLLISIARTYKGEADVTNADTETREKLSVIPKGHWKNKFHSVHDAVFANGAVNKAGEWFAVMEWPSRDVAETVAAKHMIEFAGWVEAIGITYLGPVFFPAQEPQT